MRHLFVCHGNQHDMGTGRFWCDIPIHFTIDDIRKGRVVTTDIEPLTKPDLVWDFTAPLPPAKLKSMGRFDIISGRCCSYTVYHEDGGWKTGTFTNVSALLKNGGKFIALMPMAIVKNTCFPNTKVQAAELRSGYACVARACRAFLKASGLPLRLLNRRDAAQFLTSVYKETMPVEERIFIFEKCAPKKTTS